MKQLSIKEALQLIENKNKTRYAHILGTYEKAKELAELYHINEYKCMMSAILHDYAKNETMETLRQIIIDHLDPTLLQYDPVVYHGYVGSYLIQKDLGIDDLDIINAVKYHVTGRPEMNDIDKIVYIADYTEKNRKQLGVEYCRLLSRSSLDLGVLAISDETLGYLKRKNDNKIHPLTQATYQSFLEKVGVENYRAIKNDYKGL